MNELVSEKYMTGKTLKLRELNLLEMMEVCSNMYLTRYLAVQILGTHEDFSEMGESSLISEILLLEFPPFVGRLMQIH
ncbi:hypothetical protein BH24ACI2_BH24ACI2_15670 [soil metagenome]